MNNPYVKNEIVRSSKFERLWATKNKNDEWWSSFVTSPLAVIFNLVVVDWPLLTPNRLTTISFLCSIVAAIFILIGTFPYFASAVIFLHLSHILDCMDGQMAKYRGISSSFGSYYDKVTDQIKIYLLFGSVAYTCYQQTHDGRVIFLAFTGVAFYYIRVYVKYLTIFIETENNPNYMADFSKKSHTESEKNHKNIAGPGAGFLKNLIWLFKEQRKFFLFNETVFIFLISFGLLFDQLTLILWIFAVSQVFYGVRRSWQRGLQIYQAQHEELLKPLEK